MIDQLRNLFAPSAEPEPETQLPSLRRLTAYLFIAGAAGAALGRLGRRHRPAGGLVGATEPAGTGSVSPAAVAAPLLIGPLAAAAQLAHLREPTEQTRAAARFLNAAVIGVGAMEFAGELLGSARTGKLPSTAPLLFGSVGALGMLLDAEEQEWEAERTLLLHRARVVERLVPRRRARLDRVVVHV